MEKCMCCGQETSHTATVYLKAPGTSPVKQTEYFCGNCVKKRSGGLSSIIFYLALQLCWFTALKTGLFTPFGILSACNRTGRAVAAHSLRLRPLKRKIQRG